MSTAWLEQKEFRTLCDIVARDRTVVVTGAGTSYGFVNTAGKEIPGWKELLTTVLMKLSSSLTDQERDNVKTLLGGTPDGVDCIEAATILARAYPARFEKELRKTLTPENLSEQPEEKRKQLEELHEAILRCHPRGIMTFNVDGFHRQWLKDKELHESWLQIDPTLHSSEAKMRDWIRGKDSSPFLLEAHGSLEQNSRLIFTHDQYRDLIQRQPAYGAFVQNLLTNYSFVVIGYGLSDMDFDMFFDTMAMQFGEALHDHIKIDKVACSDSEKRRRTRLNVRYGVHFVDAPNYENIPTILSDASKNAGPELEKLIDDCLSDDVGTRISAHQSLRQLGNAGRSIASQRLRDEASANDDSLTRRTEAIYSLKHLRSKLPQFDDHDRATRDFLFELLLRTSNNKEILAHALMALESFARVGDESDLEKIGRRLESEAGKLVTPTSRPDPDDRLPVYVEKLICQLRAQRISDDGNLPKRRWELLR